MGPWERAARFAVAGNLHGVVSQEFEERFGRVRFFGKGKEALLEIGKFSFGLARGFAAVQSKQGND